MKFIDEAVIHVAAGHGGAGAVSFRREKYVPRGGPDGGNGGKGGDVVLQVEKGMSTLMDLRAQKHVRAKDGGSGGGAMRDGAAGPDVILRVPIGTMAFDDDSGELLADLTEDGQVFCVAQGGRGGKGNTHFKSSRHQAPQHAQPGEDGTHLTLRLELKLLADVGLVGEPNAGKSTLLSVISKAHPKIADYPFTTLTPVLGVVSHKNFSPFTVADIPGLIEGAHEGHGLGLQFLKHIERTRLFLHLVSISPDETCTPLKRFQTIQKELIKYDPEFSKRPVAVVLTKIDLASSAKELKKVEAQFERKKLKVFPISSATGAGLVKLLDYMARAVKQV